MPLGHEPVVGTEAVEADLLKGEPRGAAVGAAKAQQARITAEAAAEDGGTRRHRILDHHPAHVRLRLEFQMHPQYIAARPPARALPLDGAHGPGDLETGGV